MGNSQSRRAAREQQRKKNSRKYVAAGGAAVVLLAGGTLAYTLVNHEDAPEPTASSSVPDTCTSTQRVTVATNATMSEVLKKIPVDAQDCITLAVSDEASDADIAAQITSGKNAPNLWIPDSSTRVQFNLKDQKKVVSKSDSLAKTPGIIVTADDKTSFETWNAALSDNSKVAMGDPKVNSGAFVALLNAAAEASNGAASTEALDTNTSLRAQTIGVDSPAKNSEELITAVKDGSTPAAIVTESDYAQYLADHEGTSLKASVPASGAGELNYPLYQLASNETNKTISTAAQKIQDFLKTDDGKKALADAGLRASDGTALASASVGSVTAPEVKNPELVATTWQAYALKSAPMNALVAVDTSGSMSYKIGDTDQTRMKVTLDSLLAGSQLFPPRDSMGLWVYSQEMGQDADGKTVDYKELVPVRNLDAEVDGKTQREALQNAIQSIEPDVSKGTAFNNALLAEFSNIKGNYKADAANIVIMITDGANENNTPNSISTEDMIKTIQSEQDPDNPVYFVLIGISSDANIDSLKDIAKNVGGEAYLANSPSDIQKIFQDGLSSVASQGAAAQSEGATPAADANQG